MRVIGLIACLLVILCFWQLMPFVAILLAVGVGLALSGILLGAALNAGAKKILGK